MITKQITPSETSPLITHHHPSYMDESTSDIEEDREAKILYDANCRSTRWRALGLVSSGMTGSISLIHGQVTRATTPSLPCEAAHQSALTSLDITAGCALTAFAFTWLIGRNDHLGASAKAVVALCSFCMILNALLSIYNATTATSSDCLETYDLPTNTILPLIGASISLASSVCLLKRCTAQ